MIMSGKIKPKVISIFLASFLLLVLFVFSFGEYSYCIMAERTTSWSC